MFYWFVENPERIQLLRRAMEAGLADPLKRELELARTSGYALWWRCLLESEDYAAALKGERDEPWAGMAQYFGRLIGDFDLWWLSRGRYLFAERVYEAQVAKLELDNSDAKELGMEIWRDDARPNLYLRIPLTLSRKSIIAELEKIIDQGLEENWPQIKEAKFPKRGFYPDQRIRRETVEILLAVWEARKAGEEWYAIGERLALRPEFTLQPTDDATTAKHKRRMMTLTVQRYHKMAKALIDFAAKGDFPRVK